MPHSTKSNSNGFGAHDVDNFDSLPICLWISNFGRDVSETDLLKLFENHRIVGILFVHAAKSYAFVYFKGTEDATVAKDTFNETTLKSSVLKIEIARKSRENKNLWVGGISQTLSKEILEAEFSKFGRIYKIKFFRERNTAIVEFVKLKDAHQAIKAMNGKQVCGDQLYVDFLRAQPSKRHDRRNNFDDLNDGPFDDKNVNLIPFPWMFNGSAMNYSENFFPGPRLQQASPFNGGKRYERQCSNVLWIGYPPSVHIDDQMLHNAMILFGEIERIRSFPSYYYSLVEFRSAEEAKRAKEGLQGRLFNDPRILIVFSSGDPKDYPGANQPVPQTYMFTGNPFRPPQSDVFTPNFPSAQGMFPPRSLPPSGMLAPNMFARPFGPQGGFDPFVGRPEFMDWKPPLVAGMPSHVSDTQLQRESKRSRIDGSLSVDNSSQNSIKCDLNHPLRIEAQPGVNTAVRPENTQPNSHDTLVGGRLSTVGSDGAHSGGKHFTWCGVIAKGGTPVCRARCVPMGKGIESKLSQVVNCSARTGLDMLSRHYAEAIGFEMIFFIPDSQADFAPYTEFLHYLGEKDRAGVAKLDDGTTLFLVPPSNFLRSVLNVSGPDHLYGVVLKMPQYPPVTDPVMGQPPNMVISSQYPGIQQAIPLQNDSNRVIAGEEQAHHVDNNRVLHVDPPRLTNTSVTGPPPVPLVQSVPQTLPPTGTISLTPELLATLASLLPSNSLTYEAGNHSFPSSNTHHPVAATAIPENSGFPVWRQQIINQPDLHSLPSSLSVAHPPVSTVAIQYAEASMNLYNTIMDPTTFFPSNSPMPVTYPTVSLAGSFTNTAGTQHYQLEATHNSQMGMSMGTAVGDVSGFYNPLTAPQYGNPAYPSDQFQVSSVSAKMEEPLKQVQQNWPGGNGSNNTNTVPETEDDKNQRYQSTLKFAAGLLLQIQQQQQQLSCTKAQAGGGSGSQH